MSPLTAIDPFIDLEDLTENSYTKSTSKVQKTDLKVNYI